MTVLPLLSGSTLELQSNLTGPFSCFAWQGNPLVVPMRTLQTTHLNVGRTKFFREIIEESGGGGQRRRIDTLAI